MKKWSINVMSLVVVCTIGITGYSQDTVDPSTLNNKVMAGYQGWFNAEGDGSGYGWIHWSRRGIPTNDNLTFDMWPDLREYDKNELFKTRLKYSNQKNASVYSAYTYKTVERHVKWMKDYGIDGVFVQRFVGSARNRTKLRDKVLQNVRKGAEKYGRVFANMYDISGGGNMDLVEFIKKDWMHLVDDLNITESPSYICHNGRPVLSIWGFGFKGRPGTPEMALELIQWLTVDAPDRYLVTLKVGVPNTWQNQTKEWQEVYKKVDIISPWAVGRYKENKSADKFRKTRIEPDLSATTEMDIDYMPVVFPGFSWGNLKIGAPFNKIKRNGGKFLWHQYYNAIDAGCNMIYVAMYDEVDEGTAIYKVAENQSQVPTTGTFLTLDADGVKLPSDWYLRLTGEASKMLRGEIPLSSEIPIIPFPSK